jgi:hypothetical protein
MEASLPLHGESVLELHVTGPQILQDDEEVVKDKTEWLTRRRNGFRAFYEHLEKINSRSGASAGGNEVAREKFMLGDVRKSLTANQKTRDCLCQKEIVFAGPHRRQGIPESTFNFANFDSAASILNPQLNGGAGSINGTGPNTVANPRPDRIGAGSGVFAFGAPRTIEWGLKLQF